MHCDEGMIQLQLLHDHFWIFDFVVQQSAVPIAERFPSSITLELSRGSSAGSGGGGGGGGVRGSVFPSRPTTPARALGLVAPRPVAPQERGNSAKMLQPVTSDSMRGPGVYNPNTAAVRTSKKCFRLIVSVCFSFLMVLGELHV